MIPLTIATALGSGLVGGAFYAFSSFVMPALERLPAHEGIAAMQSINVTAVQPPFMVGFIGTALASAATIVVGAFELSEAHGAYMVAGGALYLIGTHLNGRDLQFLSSGGHGPSIGPGPAG